jgi:Zn-dependent protease with chaperone function
MSPRRAPKTDARYKEEVMSLKELAGTSFAIGLLFGVSYLALWMGAPQKILTAFVTTAVITLGMFIVLGIVSWLNRKKEFHDK